VCDHLLSEQIQEHHGRVAFGALAAQTDGAAKEIAVRAAPLADEAFTTTGALVDRVREDRAPLLELLTEALQVRQARLVTQAERTLLMGARTIACAR
jgi:hypothetical protein